MLFSALITVAGFVPLFTMQGVEGQIFGPMARTYGYALAGALIATFTVTPVLASLLLPEHVKEAETLVVRALHRLYTPALRFALAHRAIRWRVGVLFVAIAGCSARSWAANSCRHSRKGISGSAPRCRSTLSLAGWRGGHAENAADSAATIRKSSRSSRSTAVPMTAAMLRRFSNVELFAAAQAVRAMAKG